MPPNARLVARTIPRVPKPSPSLFYIRYQDKTCNHTAMFPRARLTSRAIHFHRVLLTSPLQSRSALPPTAKQALLVPETSPTTTTTVSLPNPRLMARAFRRAPAGQFRSSSPSRSGPQNWEGRQPEEHTARETDTQNVQQDATRDGKKERSEGEGSRGATEKAGESNRKAKEEFPEAPDTIGMQDERGHSKR